MHPVSAVMVCLCEQQIDHIWIKILCRQNELHVSTQKFSGFQYDDFFPSDSLSNKNLFQLLLQPNTILSTCIYNVTCLLLPSVSDHLKSVIISLITVRPAAVTAIWTFSTLFTYMIVQTGGFQSQMHHFSADFHCEIQNHRYHFHWSCPTTP